MNYWTTKNGNKIKVENLEHTHLLNILYMLKEKTIFMVCVYQKILLT